MSSKYDTDDFELVFELKWKRISPKEKCITCDGAGEVYTKADVNPPKIPEALIDDLKTAWDNHNFPKKVCPKCDGYGDWDDAEPGDISYNTFTCDKCDGTGKIDVDQKKESTCEYCKGSGYDGQYMCQGCSGTGTEPKVFKCRECNGTGDYEDPATRFETTIECPFCDGNGEV